VYLDAPGGTQTPDEVAEAVARVLREASGNMGAPYATSRRIEALVAHARAASARFLGCTPDEIIFGASMTSLNFTLTRTLGRELRRGDEIVVTRLDHDGNVAPWLDLAGDLGLVVRHADVRADTALDLSDLERQLGPRTKVVAFPWAANSTGTIVDARAVCDLAHAAGALAWVDAVQYAAHRPVDVGAIGADLLICSSYKFCGPHLGIAFGRRELLESWRPYKARPASSQPVGHRFETGTLPYELLGGLLAAFAYLDSLGGMAALADWERQLGERLLAGLPDAARLFGLPVMTGRVPTFLVNVPGVPSAMLSEQLAARGFGVWSHDSYYALGLRERIGWGEALRIGLAHYNTPAEIDQFLAAFSGLLAQAGAEGQRRGRGAGGRTHGGAVARPPAASAGGNAGGTTVRALLRPGGPRPDARGLVRLVAQVPAGGCRRRRAGAAGELWFVIGGAGRLEAACRDGHQDVDLVPDRGVWVPPGASCLVRAAEDAGGLRLDIVRLPAGRRAGRPGPGAPVARDLADCTAEVTGDRTFRVLFGPGRGCPAATLFVGEIPPGRAPDHSHPYDELVLVLSGEGTAHVGGARRELVPGTCLHLPPGLPHCLENSGRTPLRVLGVFHPAGSPAAKLGQSRT